MPRLCSPAMAGLTSLSGEICSTWPCFSRLFKRPVRLLVYQAWAHGNAAEPCERKRRHAAERPRRALEQSLA